MGLYLIAEITLQGTLDTVLGYAWSISMVAIGLGLVIFVHELGHFLVAKACGVKCEKFYIGFDIPISIGPLRLPSRFCRFKWGETEYGVGILPLGGYVKMLGQDDNPANAEKEAERIKVKKGQPAESNDADEPSPFAAPDRVATDGDAGKSEAFVLDPRSYPAKPVPLRMAIISAGVIMNLIFAVIFATFAFNAGVPYTPCEIGGTVPGSPAWRGGLEPGSRIVQLGENGRVSEHLRFDWDLRNAVGLAGGKEDLPLMIRQGDGTDRQITLRPMITELDGHKIPMLGVEPASSNKLSSSRPVLEGFAAENASPELKGGDRIVGVNGESIQDGYQLQTALAQNPHEPLELLVERSADKETDVELIKVTVPTNNVRRLGLIMTAGAVSGIRPGSPAETAGFQEGDEIVTVEGEAVPDPLVLPKQLRPFYGRSIEIVVQRKQADGQRHPETLRVVPEAPHSFENSFTVGSPMAVRSLGIVFPVTPRIVSVVADSPAAMAGLEVGDEIASVAFSSTDPERKKSDLINEGKPIDLNDHTFTWPFIYDRMQSIEPDVEITLSYRRGAQTIKATMKPTSSDESYAFRGLVFTSIQETRVAASWQEAVSLGFRQTKEDMMRVLVFLKKLFTGAVSPTNLGGPISIIAVAGNEASKGISTLLMFLTFLSANLAILNFLPIPALDGGHMVFLLAEGVRGKPVDERMQMALTLAGVACLLGLMIFVFALDIGRFSL